MRYTKTVERWLEIENDPDGGQLLIRHLKRGALMDISFETSQSKTSYVKDNDGQLTPEMTTVSDTRASQEKQFCAAVQGWKNFFDADGNPIECTDEKKIEAMREIEGLTNIVDEFRAALAADVRKEIETQKKT